ncbi:hypothetical protein SNE40_009817 [Patella caerulea]|uniref:Uncharacterized protein n=1 Tax=Patella caerulea TaxID=87958 RepID=A0AAN8PZ20_PATCE
MHDMSKTVSADQVLELIKLKQAKSKSYTDTKRSGKFLNLQVGDYVRVRMHTHIRKSEFQFTSPRKIVAKRSDRTYQLDDGKVWNQERLAKARVNSVPSSSHSLPSKSTVSSYDARKSDRTVNKPNWHSDYVFHT